MPGGSAGERGVLARVHDPAQDRAQGAEDSAAREEDRGADGGERDADQEGAEGRDRRGEADGAASLAGRHDHRHLLEGTGVTEAGEQEHGEHERHEDVEVGPTGGVGQHPGDTAQGDGHADAGDEGPDGTAHAVAEDAPGHADDRADEGAKEGEGRALDAQLEGGGSAELVVDEQAEDGGETGEQAEGHDVEDGHVPGVGVGEDVQLLLDVGLDGHVAQPDEGEDRREDAPRNEEGCGVVDPDLLAGGFAGDLPLGRQPGHADQAEAHEDGADQLDDGHAEVTDATLQAQGRAGETLGEEVAGGGHVAGERAAADATHEGKGQQDPVGGRVVLDDVEPARHGQDAQQGGNTDELAGADERGQEHVDEAQDAGGQARQGSQPVELRLVQVEAEGVQLGRDRAGQEPHAEGQDQRVGRDPQRAPREFRVPLGLIVGVPVSEQVAALLGRGVGRAHGSPHP